MRQQDRENKLNEWLHQHQGLLIKVARSFARSPHDRDDLIQEISLQVWNSIPKYKPEIAESTWLYRVAFYTAINWSRKEKTRARHDKEVATERIPIMTVPQEADPRIDWLYERIAELDPLDRSLSLLLLDGMSYREMAELLGISESNVGVRISRIKKKLSNQIAERSPHEL